MKKNELVVDVTDRSFHKLLKDNINLHYLTARMFCLGSDPKINGLSPAEALQAEMLRQQVHEELNKVLKSDGVSSSETSMWLELGKFTNEELVTIRSVLKNKNLRYFMYIVVEELRGPFTETETIFKTFEGRIRALCEQSKGYQAMRAQLMKEIGRTLPQKP